MSNMDPRHNVDAAQPNAPRAAESDDARRAIRAVGAIAAPGMLAAKIVGCIFGFVFAGIGITVLIFLWTARGWDAPPLFFKVFASFIAIAFVGVGTTVFFSSLLAGAAVSRVFNEFESATAEKPGETASTSYSCSHCGATLGKGADVSPLGDVKCAFCGRWFNVHKQA
jgi:hypothetical protein